MIDVKVEPPLPRTQEGIIQAHAIANQQVVEVPVERAREERDHVSKPVQQERAVHDTAVQFVEACADRSVLTAQEQVQGVLEITCEPVPAQKVLRRETDVVQVQLVDETVGIPAATGWHSAHATTRSDQVAPCRGPRGRPRSRSRRRPPSRRRSPSRRRRSSSSKARSELKSPPRRPEHSGGGGFGGSPGRGAREPVVKVPPYEEIDVAPKVAAAEAVTAAGEAEAAVAVADVWADVVEAEAAPVEASEEPVESADQPEEASQARRIRERMSESRGEKEEELEEEKELPEFGLAAEVLEAS